MQTRTLRTLVRIARVESFAAAAEQLNMTLSAVSMQMKGLEQQLGIELFDRTFRPPKLTPLGRTIVPHAERLVGAEDALLHACQPRGTLAGKFHIGFVDTASVRLLPGFLRRAATLAPEAHFVIETGLSDRLEARVLGGELDAAIITETIDDSDGLKHQLLYVEPLIFAVNRDAQAADIARLAATVPFLQFMPHSGIGKLIAREIRRFIGDDAPPAIVLDSVEAILECIKEGIGFTLLPEPDIRRYADETVIALAADDIALERHLVLVTREGPGAPDPAQLEALLLR